MSAVTTSAITNAQSGILPEHCRSGLFLELTITDLAKVKQGCASFLTQLEALQQNYPDAKLGAVIAFGDPIWKQLAEPQSAVALKPFVTLGKGNLSAPATQRDMLIHIQSLRVDVSFSAGQMAMAVFGEAVQVEEETHGFRWIEERDLTGFIDGTENPQGAEARAQVALVADGIDQGGSYVLTQRYEHQLDKWQKLSVSKQESVFGRTKVESEELEDVPETSHVGRVDLKENGVGLKLVRQSLPYGKVSGAQGLYFISYCACLHNIEQQLLSMFGELDNKTDRMLGFTQAVSGSYYYAPSFSQLQTLSA
ncbi:Dyp-type peroxidase [Testudinibacter sp. TR-2022]|uniref:Dyp-type peroxidase n=1 Tax=Testudinibacter sp. TR-2022 TaxID=2585029 RepID=UPI00111B72C7|nr:Dyp-type peroxidase [Testudinibacter sp. TR-2022]TNH06298.1 Dyp-type peroxidase [Pasteurellaceae bacterium Phil11]TNH19574.1 Dyp-type peroxidase [Testudinibacter sp. TR-2022]TNH28760.1 Dyp-type peroxidase [Testudinibacter sp. TR-2022]